MSTATSIVLWVGLCLALALGILVDLFRPVEEMSRVRAIPMYGLGFTGSDLPLNESELSLYKKAEVVKRCYRVGRNRFMLIAIDGARNRHAVHDPQYCFRGAGWTVQGRERFPIEGGEAVLLHLEKGDARQDVAYWFSDGRRRHGSVVRYWLQATLRRMTLGRSGREPILVMIQSMDDEPINVMQIVDQFGALFEI
ncbi:MAG TPA: exosortase-associated EpsI family protein [Deltaproteobacteria bacterium]|nr:exosortase-associated EpsI family protein [Deltaproteobacteria bacterium]HQI80658.1 exosortase-associated EpsI family protein [Deltaproteobacteria bacterium]